MVYSNDYREIVVVVLQPPFRGSMLGVCFGVSNYRLVCKSTTFLPNNGLQRPTKYRTKVV